MATGEEQLEPLIRDRRLIDLIHLVLDGLRQVEQCGRGGEPALAADVVDRSVARRRQQPGTRVGGRAVARPALGGDRERLLDRLLGEVEVAEEADQADEDTAPLVAEDLLERRYQYTSLGRISIAPPRRAAGIRAASSIAASRSSASRTK
jgi:hypothetical protein